MAASCGSNDASGALCGLRLDSSLRIPKDVWPEQERPDAISMRRRINITIVAVLALLVNSVCLCAGAAPICSAASCAAHERDGTCPSHRGHHESPGSHECCQTAACSNPTEIGTNTDSLAGNHLPAPPFSIVRVPIFDLGAAQLRLVATTEAHSPPPAVPVFLAIHALLL